MKRILYWDCSAGISGDMAVASLLDLGVDAAALQAALATLPLEGYAVKVSRVTRSGLDACDFDVRLDDPSANRDHDMAYLYGPEAFLSEADEIQNALSEKTAHQDHHHHHDDPVRSRVHDDSESSTHEHSDVHENHHGHAHGATPQRNLADIRAIIEGGDLPKNVQELALSVFQILAEAEAAVHGKPVDEVHFHEVGAVDSIVDIVAAAFCFDALAPDEVIVPRLVDGQGMVRCQHGLIPVPVPAVATIARVHQLPLRLLPVEGELTTPTGAAIVAALHPSHRLPDDFVIDRIGLGAGKRAYATSGMLRALLIHPA